MFFLLKTCFVVFLYKWNSLWLLLSLCFPKFPECRNPSFLARGISQLIPFHWNLCVQSIGWSMFLWVYLCSNMFLWFTTKEALNFFWWTGCKRAVELPILFAIYIVPLPLYFESTLFVAELRDLFPKCLSI